MTKPSAEELLAGYTPVGLCIMSDEYVSILIKQYDEHPDFKPNELPHIKAVMFDLSIPEDSNRWTYTSFEYPWYYPSITHTERDEFIIVDRNGIVYYHGLGSNKQFEEECIPEIPLGPRQIKNIDGTIVGAGVGRSFWMRKGIDDWTGSNTPRSVPGYDKIRDPGFMALDGFSLDDIYCAGGDKDVWHYNVSADKWKPIDIGDGDFTCNDVLCCKEDGYVYITGRYGLLARGRDDEWEIINTIYPEDFKNIVYYQGKILIGTERCTFVLQDDLSIEVYDFEQELDFHGGHLLYTAHGMLLIANLFNQIALHDGTKWINVHGCDELNPLDKQRLIQEENERYEKAKAILDDIKKEMGEE